MIHRIWWFVYHSLELDYKLLKFARWDLSKKINFIFLKYILLIKHFFIPFKFGNNFVKFDNKTIFYDCRYGIAGLQATLARHQQALEAAGVDKAETIVDVGANVGFFSLMSKFRYPECEILAIEPIPRTYDVLEKNLSNFNKCTLYQLATSSSNEPLLMNFDENYSSVSQVSNDGRISIEGKRLDDIIAEKGINRIDILKIDTESHESSVLSGATKSLEIAKYLFLEITLDENPNYTLSSLMSQLYTDKYNYQLLFLRQYNHSGSKVVGVLDCLFINTCQK
jgi:FkbM family methyltransferase